MQAARQVERGLPIGIQTLFGSMKENARTLLALGALYLCCTLGVLGLSTLLDGGDMFKFMMANSRAERAAVEDADFIAPALFVMVTLCSLLADSVMPQSKLITSADRVFATAGTLVSPVGAPAALR